MMTVMTVSITLHRGYLGPAGRQLHYRRAGTGSPLVLLHQTPESSAVYLSVFPALAAEHDVIAFDTPGYGQSDRPDPPFTTIPEFAERLMEGIDALGVDRFALAGHLTGAVIATEIAAAHPERVSALVLSEPFNWFTERRRESHLELHQYYPYDPTGRHLLDAWNRYRPALDLGFTPEEVQFHTLNLLIVNAPCERYGHMGWEGAAPDAMTRYPFWERAAQIQAPTLVLHGAESGLVRAHQRCLDTIPASEGRVVPGVTALHFAKLPRGLPQDAPEQFASLVLDFLKRQS